MYSEPVIVPSKRAYVKVYIDGKRYRFYNGHQLGINCNPNHCKTPADQEKALSTLQYTLKKKLETGWRSGIPVIQNETAQSATSVIKKILDEVESEQLSITYLRQLKLSAYKFLSCIINLKTDISITDLQPKHIKAFLAEYKYSKSYYMYVRQGLSGLFSRILDKELIVVNPVHKTQRVKVAAVLHKPYNREQLIAVLERLKTLHSHLHLCALIMYGCLLRPHREIRLLTRADFSTNMTTISLSGSSNKGKKVRVVMVPEYVRMALLEKKVDRLPNYANIFTGNISGYGEYYFKTAWKRVARKLLEEGLITEENTLYSFRHTAAINVYQKTKDPYKLQRMMGHSSLTVTLTYLRNLGLIVNADNEEDLPDLI